MFFIVIPIAGNNDQGKRRWQPAANEADTLLLPGYPDREDVVLCRSMCGTVLSDDAGRHLPAPIAGLPKLVLGHSLLAAFIVAVESDWRLLPMAYLVGTVFKTPNQALNFGAISIVILSPLAVSGYRWRSCRRICSSSVTCRRSAGDWMPLMIFTCGTRVWDTSGDIWVNSYYLR